MRCIDPSRASGQAYPEEEERQRKDEAKAQEQRRHVELKESIAKLRGREAKQDELRRAKRVQQDIKGAIDELDTLAERTKARVLSLKASRDYRTDDQIEALETEMRGLNEVAEMVKDLNL